MKGLYLKKKSISESQKINGKKVVAKAKNTIVRKYIFFRAGRAKNGWNRNMDNGIIVLNLVESNNPHNKPIIAQDFSNGTCLNQIKFMTEQQIKKLAKRSLLTEASYQKAGAINNRHNTFVVMVGFNSQTE